jgi:AICAR transformylase/IMP cyclohydrolase PurH
MRDAEVIEAGEQIGVAMVLTTHRHSGIDVRY